MGTNSIPTTAPPRVSVAMATYNYGQFIGQAIASVIGQTFDDWELVIIDDGSTDDTTARVAPLLSDPRVRYVRQDNQGVSRAKNAAIRRCRGGLIAFLDADDAWLPDKLARQIAIFDTDPELGVVYCRTTLIDEKGLVLETPPRPMCRGHLLPVALRRTIPPFSSSIVCRKALDDVGLFDESLPLAIDYELWLRIAAKYRFDYVDEPLVLYRTGHANLSRRGDERRQLVLNTILPRFLNEHGGRRLVSRRAIAEAYADTYANMGDSVRPKSLGKALFWSARACITAPWMLYSWKTLARICLPTSVVTLIRTMSSRGH